VIESLVTHHLPLGALQGEAGARIAVIWVDAHHMGTVFRPGTIRRELNAGETKHKPDQLVLNERADYNPAVVHGGDQHVGRDHIGLAARPNNALKSLHS
jgi:hypothetical protein